MPDLDERAAETFKLRTGTQEPTRAYRIDASRGDFFGERQACSERKRAGFRRQARAERDCGSLVASGDSEVGSKGTEKSDGDTTTVDMCSDADSTS